MFGRNIEPEEDSITLKEALGILKENVGDYFVARRELLEIELGEASAVLAKKVALLLMAAVMGVFAYFLFWVVAIMLIAQVLQGHLGEFFASLGEWVLVSGVVVVIHAVVLVVLLKMLKRKPDVELFAVTKSELQKDKEWLARNK